MKKLLIIWMMIQTSWAQDSAIEKNILEKIKKTDPVCKSCRMIVQQKKSPWVKNHTLYEVTTFDILPPPAWSVAVKDKEIFSLDRRRIDDWNAVMMNEKIMLDKDPKVVDYVKFFLSTTMNQSEYIDKLLESEVKRIEAKEKKKIDREAKINRSADKIQIVFYANDTQGDLQQWNVVLKENGEIVKLQQRSY
jgi:adenylate kinase family enzyme